MCVGHLAYMSVFTGVVPNGAALFLFQASFFPKSNLNSFNKEVEKAVDF